jgi:hypothetical protein
MHEQLRLIGRDDVFRDPTGVAEALVSSADIYGLRAMEMRIATVTLTVFWLILDPWKPMAARGYPSEEVAITVWRNGSLDAVPIRAEARTWQHRNPRVFGSMQHLGALCLWFPGDPRPLRWGWTDGFAAYITIVHRHLQAEEYFRREHVWPSEDAPHGRGDHPIRTLPMRLLAAEGAR